MTTPEREREPSWITCGCGARWTARSAAHCGSCHRLFAGPSLFDQHRSAAGPVGTCRDPAILTATNGDRVMFHRNGMWRGPETDPDKAPTHWAPDRASRQAPR